MLLISLSWMLRLRRLASPDSGDRLLISFVFRARSSRLLRPDRGDTSLIRLWVHSSDRMLSAYSRPARLEISDPLAFRESRPNISSEVGSDTCNSSSTAAFRLGSSKRTGQSGG